MQFARFLLAGLVVGLGSCVGGGYYRRFFQNGVQAEQFKEDLGRQMMKIELKGSCTDEQNAKLRSTDVIGEICQYEDDGNRVETPREFHVTAMTGDSFQCVNNQFQAILFGYCR